MKKGEGNIMMQKKNKKRWSQGRIVTTANQRSPGEEDNTGEAERAGERESEKEKERKRE